MSDVTPSKIETLLSRAFAPVEPPESLAERLESRLAKVTDLAIDELESWELSAMRDPRNWAQAARPIAAVAVAGTAATALAIIRVRNQQKHSRHKSADPIEAAERTLKAVADEVRSLLRR